MDLAPLAQLLAQMGCPPDRVDEMAVQLNRRALQLAEGTGRTHAEALTHLLRLMAGGWAAQERLGNTDSSRPSVPPPDNSGSPPTSPTSH